MDKKVRQYIENHSSPQKEICLKLREIILKTFPDSTEDVKWGALTFSGGKFYIGALRDHVNLGVSIVGLAEKDIAFFEGKGKTMRHIKIWNLEGIDEKKIVKLLKIARECQGDC